LTRIILSLDAENAALKERVALWRGQLFGPKSEKMATIDPTQATLDLGDLSDILVAANDDVAPVADRTT
jgi:transposase